MRAGWRRNRSYIARFATVTKSSSRPRQHSPRKRQPAEFILFVLLGVLAAQPARSDELQPGYLELRQTATNTYNLLFKIPARGGGEDLRVAVFSSCLKARKTLERPVDRSAKGPSSNAALSAATEV